MAHYFTNNEDLKSKERNLSFKISNQTFAFIVDNGIFSKKNIDFGSRLLITTLNKEELKGKLLDIGCGYGVIGICLAKLKDINVHMSDINIRAVDLAKRNSTLNKVDIKIYHGNGYEVVTEKFDYIVTNPPIRAGKKVVYDFIMNARDHLNKNGELWLVIRKQQGAKSLLKDMTEYYEAKVVVKESGYFIIMAKKLDK